MCGEAAEGRIVDKLRRENDGHGEGRVKGNAQVQQTGGEAVKDKLRGDVMCDRTHDG